MSNTSPLDSMTIVGWEAQRDADVSAQNHGSIFMLRPNTPAAHEWITNNIPSDVNWFGGAFAVEPRFICDIIDGMKEDGLVVK